MQVVCRGVKTRQTLVWHHHGRRWRWVRQRGTCGTVVLPFQERQQQTLLFVLYFILTLLVQRRKDMWICTALPIGGATTRDHHILRTCLAVRITGLQKVRQCLMQSDYVIYAKLYCHHRYWLKYVTTHFPITSLETVTTQALTSWHVTSKRQDNSRSAHSLNVTSFRQHPLS